MQCSEAVATSMVTRKKEVLELYNLIGGSVQCSVVFKEIDSFPSDWAYSLLF
jgi:hypothetical protein